MADLLIPADLKSRGSVIFQSHRPRVVLPIEAVLANRRPATSYWSLDEII